MLELLCASPFFGLALTVVTFCIGAACQNRWKKPFLNPILISAAMVILVLYALEIPVEKYRQDCQLLTYLITPATICLAISFYEQLQNLKKHLPAIMIGVTGGARASLLSIWALCRIFGFDQVMTVSLLPKSVTAAIGVALSEQAGGVGALTTAAISATGILGNIVGPSLAKLLDLKDPISLGVAFGTSSHVVGTSRAMELSELAGAVSGLSLTLAGLITTVILSFFR